MESIFQAKSYKDYLLEAIAASPNAGRGLRKQLATHIGCQVGYITQILRGDSHFSPEQGESAARFFHLTPKETEYFLLLIAQNRAGTSSLKSFYDDLLARQRKDSKLLKSRLAIEGPESKRYYETYYSSWHYASVHMALHVPSLRNPQAIGTYLGISPRRVSAVLAFLVEHQLAKKDQSEFQVTDASLHLEKKSPLIAKHHSNWRIRAILSAEENAKALHYSGVITCSRSDLRKIQEKLSKCLEECIEIVKKSPAEEPAVLNIDLFSLGREG
ncbi:MAG: TIGR02147 family protein [Bdellovibrionota bacterium]